MTDLHFFKGTLIPSFWVGLGWADRKETELFV
jgi:hypothetical protein